MPSWSFQFNSKYSLNVLLNIAFLMRVLPNEDFTKLVLNYLGLGTHCVRAMDTPNIHVKCVCLSKKWDAAVFNPELVETEPVY